MITCPSCGRQNPPGARFCNTCATPLPDTEDSRREERKVVTVVFVDLVGFTARAERLDPEDVRALLAPYHAHLRAELERHGGRVEKFVGDAVMALFGAPSAHEDDPERAVRAALAIRDWVEGGRGELQVRIGVNTGEALVSLGARPEAGEAMAAGDVVNTAARLQAAAPVNGILAGEQTYRSTRDAIDYEPAEPVDAKGKSAPVRAWAALRARARPGAGLRRDGLTPLAGRRRELELAVAALARVREERSPQLLTVVGVPGIGKSRFVLELSATLEHDPELIAWRQGRSLPYGDGVAFWAVAEIVKSEAGILEGDGDDDAAVKLRRSVEAVLDDASEAAWVERQLAPLVGLGDEQSGSREERFAAWRRFLEGLAERRPLVLVFEDLHWADEALLDFVDELAARAIGVPLLVLGTARPEFLQRRPGWGGGKPNALTVSLAPLSDEETGRLVSALVERAQLEPAMRETLLARAGGNPLYAEQYARMLLERGDLGELPETVHGIIAARLDVLDEPEKRLLQDAAVVGREFWLGALEAIGGDQPQAAELLFALERKEFVRRARRTSLAGESEYAFSHLLIRDVAYAQIPRRARAEKHRRAAEWIESLGRPGDRTEMLAHHYVRALELGEAAGLDVAELRVRAGQALRDAGDRAGALYARDAAERLYDAALRLYADDDPGRPELLLRRAMPLGYYLGGGDPEPLTAARDALLATGDRVRAAEAEMALAQSFWIQGERRLRDEHAERAVALVAGTPPSRSSAWILAREAIRALLAGELERAIEVASEARAVSETLGWDEGLSDALNTLGSARVGLGDPAGVEDLERSIEVAAASDGLDALARAWNNLAAAHQILGELDAAATERAKAAHTAERFGSTSVIAWYRAVLADHRYRGGDWQEASRLAADFVAAVEAGSPHVLAWQVYGVRAKLRLALGDVAGSVSDAERALELGIAAGEAEYEYFVRAAAGAVLLAVGQQERAASLARGYLDLLRRGAPLGFAVIELPTFASAAIRLDFGHELLGALDRHPETRWTQAVRAYAAGDFFGAAELLGRIGARPEEAEARVRAAAALLAGGDPAGAAAQAEQAVAFWRSVGATRFVDECEKLLTAGRAAAQRL